jgi:hypothetical protein
MIIDREGNTQSEFVAGKLGKRRKFISANKPKGRDRKDIRADLL